ncbi:hypothetical protein R6Q59_019266 [Mikania micrantha]|uniref:DUF7086 domain-containing protein n=1 Tax=Mikania micrantha TaxID=192012 RepID=A0A5N6LXZ8_9ASTR|nr:hypothetical protein E3N88_34390 [Mikania micrantha]
MRRPSPPTGDGQTDLKLSLQPPRVMALPPPRHHRRNPRQLLAQGKSPTIVPPFRWATNHRATVHSLKTLTEIGIHVISGDVQCKRCNRQYQIEHDVKAKFGEISRYVIDNKYKMNDRAPPKWLNPVLPNCRFCDQENCVKPIMAQNKKDINWLFLLLGQMLGCCTLAQLKYFCKHTRNHRTGAKDRVLFLTYLGLCKQLEPSGPFDRL